MARAGPRKVERYGDRFKATAVKLSGLPGVRIRDVAAALDIHPFMLSPWRKQIRHGVIVAKGAKRDVKTKAKLKGGEATPNPGTGSCYVEFGDGRIGRVDPDFLTGPTRCSSVPAARPAGLGSDTCPSIHH